MLLKYKSLSALILFTAFDCALAGMEVVLPDAPDTIESLPVFISISPALGKGENLRISNNNNQLIDLKIENGTTRFFSTRLVNRERGKITVARVNGGRIIESKEVVIPSDKISEPRENIECAQAQVTNLYKRNGELKMVLGSSGGFGGEIVLMDSDFKATINGGKLLPKEFFFQIKGAFTSDISYLINNANKCGEGISTAK